MRFSARKGIVAQVAVSSANPTLEASNTVMLTSRRSGGPTAAFKDARASSIETSSPPYSRYNTLDFLAPRNRLYNKA